MKLSFRLRPHRRDRGWLGQPYHKQSIKKKTLRATPAAIPPPHLSFAHEVLHYPKQPAARMKLIQPNCRAQFTVEDMDFLVATLASSDGDHAALTRLFTDPEAMDAILDDERLFRALLERAGCLKVSRHFYFYVLVRHVLRRSGIEDRGLADYVAEMLAEFALEDARRALDAEGRPMDYLVEMLAALEKADDRTRFLIRAHIGNHSLFFTGVFPERVCHRARFRGAPEIGYYESLGSASYRVAGDHRMAQTMDLSTTFAKLAEGFHSIRVALNDMSDRLVSLGDTDASIEKLLRPSTA